MEVAAMLARVRSLEAAEDAILEEAALRSCKEVTDEIDLEYQEQQQEGGQLEQVEGSENDEVDDIVHQHQNLM